MLVLDFILIQLGGRVRSNFVFIIGKEIQTKLINEEKEQQTSVL